MFFVFCLFYHLFVDRITQKTLNGLPHILDEGADSDEGDPGTLTPGMEVLFPFLLLHLRVKEKSYPL